MNLDLALTDIETDLRLEKSWKEECFKKRNRYVLNLHNYLW